MPYSCSIHPIYPSQYLDYYETGLETVLESVPAYRPWQAHDPGAGSPLLARYAALPSLNKAYMVDQGYAGFLPPNKDIQQGLAQGEIEIVQTSGSTGDRVSNIWYQPWWDAAEQASWKLNAHAARLQLGGHREAILTSPLCTGVVCEDGYLSISQRTNGRFLYLNERSDPTTWTPEHMDRMIAEINRFSPEVIEANPSFLARLSRYIVSQKRTVRSPGLIIFTYENSSNLHYGQVRAAFQCPIASSYGSTEAGYVFMECEAGRWHQNIDCCHVDFLPFKPEYGGPLIGLILVTTFSNPWRALLRFDIGDIVRISTAPCACGRSEGFILEAIEGRAVNLTQTPDGQPVTQAQVDRSLSPIEQLAEYQLIQSGRSAYELRYVTAAPRPARIAEQIMANLKTVYSRPPEEKELAGIAKAWHLSLVAWVSPRRTLSYPPSPEGLAEKDSFYRPLLEGKASYSIQRSEKRKTGQMEHLSVAIVRKAGEGILAIHADESSIRTLRRRLLLQGLVEEWKGRGETRYLIFQGEDLEIWADTAPERIGQKEESDFLRQVPVRGGGEAMARELGEQKVLEMAKLVILQPDSRGILRVGLSTERVKEILETDQRNLLLFSLFLLMFGGAGIAFISRMENRHLARVREMEEKVRQSEKLSSLANLAAGVAHEIRNPLNAIGMAIQRLQREFAPSPPDAQKEYLRFTDVLRGEVKRVNQIIEQFLFFARPARLDLQAVQIREVLKDLLLLARETADQHRIQLIDGIAAEIPPLKLDRQRMHEALWNLVNNSLQAMPRGGRLEISARGHQSGKEVIIEISDTGEGIPEDHLGRIFDYYFTTKEKGMGLGLPLAHKIIQDHGGTIEVRSVVEKGTTFRVTLPVPGEEG